MIEYGKKYGKLGGIKTKELGVGIFGLTPEERSENAKVGGRVSAQQHKKK